MSDAEFIPAKIGDARLLSACNTWDQNPDFYFLPHLLRTKQSLKKSGQANAAGGAGEHIGGVVGAQIDATKADEQGDGIKKRA